MLLCVVNARMNGADDAEERMVRMQCREHSTADSLASLRYPQSSFGIVHWASSSEHICAHVCMSRGSLAQRVMLVVHENRSQQVIGADAMRTSRYQTRVASPRDARARSAHARDATHATPRVDAGDPMLSDDDDDDTCARDVCACVNAATVRILKCLRACVHTCMTRTYGTANKR